MWICVSEPFDEMKIMKEILEFLKVYDAQNITQLELLTELIADALKGKVFLLVLDDVWTTNYQKWEHIKWCLKSGDPRSRILITTRKEEVAQMMGAEERMIRLMVLTKEVCWSIFSKIAFFNREQNSQLERIGRELVHKCQGLPLAAKTLGSLMRLTRHVHQWNYILNSALWNIEDVQVNVFVPFMLSYHDLPPLEKVCLLYCCVFPKDHVIDRDELITMWLSQDFFSPSKNLEQQDLSCIEQWFELQAKDCFKNLAARSFFQDFKKDNDLIHDFLQYLTAKEYFMVDTYSNNQGREGTVSTIVNQANEKARHATLLLESDSQIPESVNMKRHLRTLFITSTDGSTFLRLNLENFKLVRTLHLSGARIAEIPKEIKELIHLRYLCISDNYHLKELPEQVCDLYNLMTLRIYRCPEFQTWPKQMSKLKNLRYLYVKGCDKIKALPGLTIWDVKIFH
ncbi:putative disease resistance protein RGA3 [Cannabis sativa]|uniref:putative disease resistance protein RGA3 n=1 Tax=Cannabis sativa TaxID=3483 RepID=UPI0029CA9F42|nr:putative disease resistance protein RGA3 [Cannabis sativa]